MRKGGWEVASGSVDEVCGSDNAVSLLRYCIALQIWFVLGNWFVPYPSKLSVYAGGLLAYVVYDLTHYFLHFGTAFNDESRKMKVCPSSTCHRTSLVDSGDV